MRGYLPSWLRLRLKLCLVLFAMSGVDSIIADDRIAARARMEAHRQGEWLLRYALRLAALKNRTAA